MKITRQDKVDKFNLELTKLPKNTNGERMWADSQFVYIDRKGVVVYIKDGKDVPLEIDGKVVMSDELV